MSIQYSPKGHLAPPPSGRRPPPFTFDTATQKARLAEDAWNTRDPARVALAYTEASQWRNRSEFFSGRAAIAAFLTRKWEKEHEYRLIKELWGFHSNRIAVRFQYEYCNAAGQWYRAYGNEQWEFDAQGLMQRREASINDVAIAEAERQFHWPLGARPADYPGLTELDM
ncbi:nuclear transport factor 2 family protein [Hymenobacter sp. H14-R3]|uniref:nuclear transport factor 2 family protein n=1 Tax=Hymenobacter sp. H14-R3 TaxID=3046308 RepID=UPI0024BB179D|nr:nuclear transport factor 2 family protein [Hymenobacter sp. H14-R3]MDJ0366769.1 nuclear transport factor 2 family protein [Hymenobacter sp. H14-R3]